MSLLEEVRGNKTLSRAGREIALAGRNVWLAGLGAIAQITEAGEDGRKLFGELVERGRPVAARSRERFRTQVEALAEKTGKTAKDLGQLAQDQAAYEGKRMLKLLNVPTRLEVRTLAARIDALTQKLDEVAGAEIALVPAETNDKLSVAAGETVETGAPTPRQRRTAKR